MIHITNNYPWFSYFKIFIIVLLFSNLCSAKLTKQSIVELSELLRQNELELIWLKDTQDLQQQKLLLLQQQIEAYGLQTILGFTTLYKMLALNVQNLLSAKKSLQEVALSYAFIQYYNHSLQNQFNKLSESLITLKSAQAEALKIERRINNIRVDIYKNIKTIRNYLYNKNNTSNNLDVKKLEANNKYLKFLSYRNSTLIQELSNPLTQQEISLNEKILEHKGNFTLPVYGTIKSNYHEKLPVDVFYHGIIISAQPNSQIVAPFHGEIVFSDTLDTFKHTIIIQHAPSLFIIISGDYNPAVLLTQLVQQHEPIALSVNNLTPIYVEIRYNNASHDPLAWIQLKVKEN